MIFYYLLVFICVPTDSLNMNFTSEKFNRNITNQSNNYSISSSYVSFRISDSDFEKNEKTESLVEFLGGSTGSNKNKSKKIIDTLKVYYEPLQRWYVYGHKHIHYLTNSSEALICQYSITPNNELFDLWYSNESRVTDIIYKCDEEKEICCNGLDCCSEKLKDWQIALIAGSCFVVVSIACFIFCKKMRKRMPAEIGYGSSSEIDENNVFDKSTWKQRAPCAPPIVLAREQETYIAVPAKSQTVRVNIKDSDESASTSTKSVRSK